MNDVSSHTVLSPMSNHQDANQFGPHHSTGPHNGRASCRSRREARAAKRRLTSPQVGGSEVLDRNTPIREDRIVRLKTVLARTGLSRSTIYRKIADGTFPAQLKISTHGTGWHEFDINRL